MRTLIAAGAMALALATGSATTAQPAAPAQPTGPSAGYLAVSGWYKDRAVQQAYTKAMTEVIRQHGYQGAVIGTPGLNLRVIEGDWLPRFMILARLPSEKNVKEFWWSDEYAEAKTIRLGEAYLDVAQVDGLPGAEPAMGPDSAYLVFFVKMTDQKRFFAEYAPFAPAVVAEHEGNFLIRSGRGDIETLEGDWLNASMVVVEFPSTEKLRAFWDSPEYKALSEVRKATGDWSVIEITPMKR